MIEFEKALELLCQNVKPLESENISVADSVGYVLAENIYSPIAMPPFNKSAMDGFAFKFFPDNNEYKLKNLIQAGQISTDCLDNVECVKIMTGAALPIGYDTVVEVEKAEINNDSVTFTTEFEKGRNVCLLGEDVQKGQLVLKENTILKTSHIALLASVGLAKVKVYQKPTVSVINTGGEIVEPGNSLSENKIYNSNGSQMLALLKNEGISADYQGIVKDVPEDIRKEIKKGLEQDLLIVTGGVSMGDYDFVPKIFKELGVKEIFHKIRIKPGKPLFFGTHPRGIVMGIPGNPVSNFMAFQLFIKTVIEHLKGNIKYSPVMNEAVLTGDFKQSNAERKNFVVSKITRNGSLIEAMPINTNGSGDIFSLSLANGVIIVEVGIKQLNKGETVKYLTWDKLD